jgi:hypothetical protein
MASEKISLKRAIHCSPHSFLFILPSQSPDIVKNIYIYTHTHARISDLIGTAYELPLLANHTAIGTFLQNRERCEVLTGYFSLGAGMAVIGRMRDIGQNVLQSPQ